MRDRFDVIVVGARVGGSSLTALLGDRGVSVLLLDRAQFPSTTSSTHFILLNRARAAQTVDFVERTNVSDVLWNSDRVVGVRLADGRPAHAEIVVGADGRHSLVAKKVAAASSDRTARSPTPPSSHSSTTRSPTSFRATLDSRASRFR